MVDLLILAPVAVMAIYAHPIEHIFSNLLPVVVTVAVLKAPLSTTWVIFAIAVISTLCYHSGN
mgnify:CR=1 FL=1